jgi:bacillithiol biosynthesis cysteine-adding enzyme BshC
MKIHSIPLMPANPLVGDYLQGKAEALQFFPYAPYEESSYHKRLDWLQSRSYPHRGQLVEGLLAYNRSIENHPAALDQIAKLREPKGLVVIAGQQAGILTGPLYTIYKAIHVIHTARQLEETYKVPVVPVFWIAGEDHDFEEINHLFLPVGEGLKKIRLELPRTGKTSASMLPLDPVAGERLISSFFAELTETEHSAAIRQLAHNTAAASGSVADWFARIMAQLFGKHGLVFVESSSPFIRELEQPIFQEIIRKNEEIALLMEQADSRIRQAGYQPQLQIDPRQANLFLYEDGFRLLLEREGERFITKDRRRGYRREELLTLLERDPQRFSANVVTRPLMQESIFPTFAFIGGPGEIAYWAYFKELFSGFGLQLPIVLPRMSFTLVEGAIARLLEQFGLNIPTVLQHFGAWKQEWLSRIETDVQAERLLQQFAATRQEMLSLYQPLVDEVIRFDAGLAELAGKNVDRLLDQVRFLQQRVERSMRNRHEVTLSRLNRIETALLPEGEWQERIYSLFFYANKYGLDLLDRLLESPLSPEPAHKVVFL